MTRSTRSQEEIERLLKGYQESGLTRRQYCAQQGIPVTTFDYYRHRRGQQKRPRRTTAIPPTPMLRVELSDKTPSPDGEVGKAGAATGGFTLVLAQGRRIESQHWNFHEADLARLIRIVEAA
jgi:hypothetical protein